MTFNILVVDDSAVMRSMIIRAIKMTGIALGDIHEAGNGKDAIDVLTRHWVDLAFVDINMPIMNGEELINAVRQNPLTRDLAVIVVSTESSDTRVERIVSGGAQFVHKPFTAETLRKVILGVTGVSNVQPASLGTVERGALDF